MQRSNGLIHIQHQAFFKVSNYESHKYRNFMAEDWLTHLKGVVAEALSNKTEFANGLYSKFSKNTSNKATLTWKF